ncbi:MAG: chitobiase/beta-hexosaminidase C-terminal domain-containing protein [Lachnospiraceae bacterium]|nr:chitobiase/beta-hexosaminidase C-terminal domain-containing protein [Lachnospiraceae bacterium]
MKKRFVRFLSVLLSFVLALECIPQSVLLTVPVQAAETYLNQNTDEVINPVADQDVYAGPSEDDPPLTDEDVALWMEENGLGSGRIITGGEENNSEPSDDDTEICSDRTGSYRDPVFRSTIYVDNLATNGLTLKDAFSLAQTKSKEKVPQIRLAEDMFIDEPILISKGKTIHLQLDCRSLFRAPYGSGKDNIYYIMDNPESTGNMFVLEEDAKLIITGGKCVVEMTDTRFTQNGVSFRENEKTYTYKTGRLVGGYISGKGGAIYANSKSTVDLRDLTIANCAAKYGGAIYAESQANIQLTNTKIVCNFAKEDGGAVYMNGARGVLGMDNDTRITANRAGDLGGAIYLDSDKIMVYGYGKTSIDNNLAVKHGGGIYLPNNGNNQVRGITFKNNVGQKYGGAIYANGKEASITNCIFTGNYSKYGGGIYFNANGCGVSGVSLTGNSADVDGGGIWVDSQDDLALSGTVVVKDNTAGGKKSNLVLQTGVASRAYINPGTGALGAGSEVWVHNSDDEKIRRLSTGYGNFDVRQFRCDKDNKHVELRDRILYIMAGSESDPKENPGKAEVYPVNYNEWKTRDITKATGEADGMTNYKFTGSDGAEYPVYYGYVSSPSHTTEGTDIVNKYYYSDGFFFTDPKKYDNHLATFGLNMAMASADASIKTQEDYRYKFTNIKSLMQQIGISENNIYINTWYAKKPTDDSIGVAIGKKTIRNRAGEEYTLVPIAVRGDGYEKEWAGNMTINGSNTDDMKDEHSGFKSARTHVMDELKYYIKNYGLEKDLKEGRVKFFITGYSRGSATANLTGKFLVDTYGENSDYKNKNQIFAYCYEVPAGGTDYRDNSRTEKGNECYYCVHNIINKVDLVPQLAPYELEFKRYGVDHYVPGDPQVKETPVKSDRPAEISKKVDNVTLYYDNDPWYVRSAKYNDQRPKMVKQLLAINDELAFVDFFSEYYITMGRMNFFDNFEAYTFHMRDNGKILENWLPELYNKVFNWNLLASDKNVTRESYSKYKMSEGEAGKQWINNGVSAQEAFRGLVQLMMSKTPEEMAKLSAVLGGVLNKFNSPIVGSGNTLLTLYDDLIGDDKGWDKSRAVQQKWLDEIWNKLTDNSYGQQGIQDVMTPAELKEFKSYYPTLMGMVFRLLKYDYDNAGTIDKSTKGEMWLAGTLAKNSDAIMQGHFPEVILAWLRSYDNWYDNDTKKIDYTGEGTPVTAAPKVMKMGEDGQLVEISDNEMLSGSGQSVYLTTGHPGDAIFYTLENNGTTSEVKLYNGNGITVNNEGSYKITAYAVNDYAKQRSKPNGESFWSKDWADSMKSTKSFRLETVATRELYYKEREKDTFNKLIKKEGDELAFRARFISGRPFLGWRVSRDEEGTSPYINEKYGFTEENLKKMDLKCMVPDTTVYIKPVYAARTKSIENLAIEKVQVGKKLPDSVTGLTYKNEGNDSVITYPASKGITVSWSKKVMTAEGKASKAPIWNDYIAKADETYYAEVKISDISSGTDTFIPDGEIAVNVTVPGYSFTSETYRYAGGILLCFEANEKIPGEEPSPMPVSGNQLRIKRTLLNAEESERTAFENRVISEYGNDGIIYEAADGQAVSISSMDVLFDDEDGKYVLAGWKVTPDSLKLNYEDGSEIPTDSTVIPGLAVITDDDFDIKTPDSDLTLEAVFAYSSTIKAVDLVLEEPEKGFSLSTAPNEAKIRITTNNTEKEYTLDPSAGFSIEYNPEGKGEEKLAEAATAYSAYVTLEFDDLRDKESGKTIKELLGYSYKGILEYQGDIELNIRNDYEDVLKADAPGILYDIYEELPVYEWPVSGYGFGVAFDPTLDACILEVYDEEAWFIVKKDAASGKLIFEDQLNDGFDNNTGSADWDGLNKLLPDTIVILTDDDSTEYLPVTWEKPAPDEFRENVLSTQMFTVVGNIKVPEDLLVYNYDTDEVDEQETLEVWCDVIIESSECTAKPMAMPAGATYHNNVSVILRTDTAGAPIWYTLDGSEPVDDLGNISKNAKAYETTGNEGIYIDAPGDTVLKAVAIKDGMDRSEILTETYTIVSKPEAEFKDDDLELLNELYLEEGMCLDDLTPYLPAGWSWMEIQDINTEYWLEDLIEVADDNNIDYGVTAYLTYNPDPEIYEDAYMEIIIPLYGSDYFVDVIDGSAYDQSGDLLYEAEEKELVYIVADYPYEMTENYEFTEWLAMDGEGNTLSVNMIDTEEEKESCPQPLKDEEDGEVYDGAAYFEMPGDDVIIKAIYKRLDESDQEIKEKNVSSLVLDRTSVELQLGDGAKYILSVNAVVSTSGEGKEPELTFKCSDSSVVSMTQTGNTATLKARKEGEAILWAGCGDKVVKCDVTVKAGPVEVSVTNGKALNKDGSAVTKAEKNDELTLQYNAPSKGYKFKKWTIKGAASISGDTGDPNATVKIRVGSRAITAEAVYVIDDSYDEEFKPKDADVPVKKLTLSNKEYYLITGEEFNLTAEAVYDEKKPDIEFKCSNTDVVTIAADKTGEGKSRAVVRSLKAGEATVYVYCGNKVKQCKVYVSDEAKGIALEDYKDILIDLKAGEQIALNATLMPESSVKQVASVKFQILNKFDAGSLNAPLKNMIDDYPELKALSGKKLPAVASASKRLITAKWPNKLTAAGMTSCMTVLRVTMKLVKDKGEKKAVEYVCDYPIRVSATDYETKRYKNTINDKDYKLSAKAARSTLDTAFEDRRGTVVTAVISKAEKKDNLTFEFTSTNENIISIENAQETAIPDAKGSKAFATAEVKAKGIGTAYVIVRSKDKTDDKKYNLSVVKITVKSGNPELILVNDSENLLPRDPNTNKIKIDPATNSVTIKMKQGSYDRFFIDLIPYVTEYSTDATKLAWSAYGGVTVKNGVVYAKKATKEGKPARVIIKCAKSKPITIYINVK